MRAIGQCMHVVEMLRPALEHSVRVRPCVSAIGAGLLTFVHGLITRPSVRTVAPFRRRSSTATGRLVQHPSFPVGRIRATREPRDPKRCQEDTAKCQRLALTCQLNEASSVGQS